MATITRATNPKTYVLLKDTNCFTIQWNYEYHEWVVLGNDDVKEFFEIFTDALNYCLDN